MKVGKVTLLNVKGQLVIPKKLRDELGITNKTPLNIVKRGLGVFICPLEKTDNDHMITTEQYLQILDKTRGAWAGDNWPTTERKRRAIELKASRRRRKVW